MHNTKGGRKVLELEGEHPFLCNSEEECKNNEGEVEQENKKGTVECGERIKGTAYLVKISYIGTAAGKWRANSKEGQPGVNGSILPVNTEGVETHGHRWRIKREAK